MPRAEARQSREALATTREHRTPVAPVDGPAAAARTLRTTTREARTVFRPSAAADPAGCRFTARRRIRGPAASTRAARTPPMAHLRGTLHRRRRKRGRSSTVERRTKTRGSRTVILEQLRATTIRATRIAWAATA